MANNKGALTLESPDDLLQKLRNDLGRLISNPLDAYAAFDFFITANHYPEWLAKAKCSIKELKKTRRNRALLNLLNQIANGAKHFYGKKNTRSEIQSTTKRDTWVQPGWMQADMYDAGALIINLEGSLSNEFGLSIEAHVLAKEIMALYEKSK